MIRVKCISNDNGRHERLEPGKWYHARIYEYSWEFRPEYVVHGLGKKEHPLDSDSGVYARALFVTEQEHRESQLARIIPGEDLPITPTSRYYIKNN